MKRCMCLFILLAVVFAPVCFAAGIPAEPLPELEAIVLVKGSIFLKSEDFSVSLVVKGAALRGGKIKLSFNGEKLTPVSAAYTDHEGIKIYHSVAENSVTFVFYNDAYFTGELDLAEISFGISGGVDQELISVNVSEATVSDGKNEITARHQHYYAMFVYEPGTEQTDTDSDTVTDTDTDDPTVTETDKVTETDTDKITDTTDKVTDTETDAVTTKETDTVTETDTTADKDTETDTVTETDKDTETETDITTAFETEDTTAIDTLNAEVSDDITANQSEEISDTVSESADTETTAEYKPDDVTDTDAKTDEITHGPETHDYTDIRPGEEKDVTETTSETSDPATDTDAISETRTSTETDSERVTITDRITETDTVKITETEKITETDTEQITETGADITVDEDTSGLTTNGQAEPRKTVSSLSVITVVIGAAAASGAVVGAVFLVRYARTKIKNESEGKRSE